MTGKALRSAFVCLVCVLWAIVPARAEGQKWALLVGIDRYQRPDITPLHFAVSDAQAVADVVRTCLDIPQERIFALTSGQSGDMAPTRTNIAFRLGWLAENLQPDDTLIFYFSGHGMQYGDNCYLLTEEADARSAQTLSMSSFSGADLLSLLNAIRARHRLVFMDACRNDPRSGRGESANVLDARFARNLTIAGHPDASASVTYFACGVGQRSYEWNERGHGFFSYFLVEGLRGKAADANGRITLHDLQVYLEHEVSRTAERVLGVKQVPYMRAEGSNFATWLLADSRPISSPSLQPSGVSPSVQASGTPNIRIAFPPANYRTSNESVLLAATVGGTRLADVSILVNGSRVERGITRTDRGAFINVDLTLRPGENTVLITAVAENGEPVQDVVTIVRTGAVVEQAPQIETVHPQAPQPSSSTPTATSAVALPLPAPSTSPTPAPSGASETAAVAIQAPATISGTHGGAISGVAFSVDGRYLFTGSADGKARVWELPTGRLTTVLSGHAAAINAIACSRDGRLLATASADKTVKLWEVLPGQLLQTISDSTAVLAVAFSPDGQALASGGNKGCVRVWNTTNAQNTYTWQGWAILPWATPCVAYSPDGRLLAWGSANINPTGEGLTAGMLFLGDVAKRKYDILRMNAPAITAVAFSPDGKRLAAVDAAREITLWDVQTGNTVAALVGHLGNVNSISFSPVGSVLASASDDMTVKLWDLSSRKVVRVLGGHRAAVLTVAFSADGRYVASGSADRVVKVWDANSGRVLLTIQP